MTDLRERVPRLLAAVVRHGVLVAGAAYIVAFLTIALWRLPHPFEVNWMEGAMVDHVQRIVEGKRLYVAPSLEFIPFLYPPGFYWASAAVAQVTGVGFLALRLVSFLSALGIFALLYLFVARETRDRFAALAACGLFAATYNLGGTYLDVGRVDALFLVLLLGALYVLRFHTSIVAHVAGGALFGLAFLTKQSALVMAAPVLLFVLWRRPRRGAVAALAAGAVMVGGTLLIDLAHDGWYRFYAFELPSGYRMHPRRLVDFWRVDVLPPLAIAWTVGLAYLLAPGRSGARLFVLATAVGVLVGASMGRAGIGGSYNALIPAFLVASLLFGLGLNRARTLLETLPRGTAERAGTWLAAACLLQFAVLAYNPLLRLPTRADAAAGRALVEKLAAVEGEVWVPYHGHLATMAGKRPSVHWMAASDILGSGHDSLRVRLQHEVDSAIAARRWGMIVSSSHPFGDSPRYETRYVPAGPAVPDGNVMWPVTGATRRPEMLHVPRAAGTQP